MERVILSNLESKEIPNILIFPLGQSFTLVLMNQPLLLLSLKVSKNQTHLHNLYHPAAHPTPMFMTASSPN
jgi:hypothetical protein